MNQTKEIKIERKGKKQKNRNYSRKIPDDLYSKLKKKKKKNSKKQWKYKEEKIWIKKNK